MTETRQAFIRITVRSAVWGVTSYNAVRMELRDGGVAFWAGGQGHFAKAEDVLGIEPVC